MSASKNLNIAEYQKCGELMVAVKRNKFAMSCKFCQQLFTQLQAFMRHLQLHHNDKLEFVKQSKEMQVYAVEELMNQTGASISPEIESEESNLVGDDESNWLTEQDMKWLKNGVEPEKNRMEIKQTKVIQTDEQEEDLGLANMSILKALEDCDVSFNLMDALNSTKSAEDKKDLEEDTNLNNTLLREIENEWNDSDSNDSEPKQIDCSNSDLANSSNYLMDLNKELALDVTMTDVINQSIVGEENLESVNQGLKDTVTKNPEMENDYFKNSPTNKIKNLLEGLNDLEDIDSLLENLEDCTEVEDEEKPVNNILLNNKLTNETLQNKSKTKIENKNIEEMETKTLNDFERRLKQLEDELEDDILDDLNTKNKSDKFAAKGNKDFASKLKDLEDSLNDYEPKHKDRKTNQILEKCTNFEMQLINLEDTLENDIEEEISNKDMQNNINALNDDVNRALAEALNDDNMELLSLQTEEVIEEPLNQDLLNLLDQELNDNETEQETECFKKIISSKTSTKNRKSLTSHKTIVKSKYQKTNLKAKTKLIGIQNTNLKSCSILKESNLIQKSELNTKVLKSKEVPLRAKHDIFENQQHLKIMNMLLQNPTTYDSVTETNDIQLKSPIKTLTTNRLRRTPGKENLENKNNIPLKSPGKTLTDKRLRKTPGKENLENKTPALNLKNIKKEKLTPANNFINTNRGDKTPLRQEQIFLKQSPKAQEKQAILTDNKTPKSSTKTPTRKIIKQTPTTKEKEIDLNTKKTPSPTNKQKTPPLIRNLKQSPKSLEKQDNLNIQHTPPTTKQKTPQTKDGKRLKESPKTQEKLKQTPNNSNNSTPKTPENLSPIISKESKNKSFKKSANKSNENPADPSNISPKQCYQNSLNNRDLKTPLTTPQRLRNVAIKLQRFTPDKLLHKQTKSQNKTLETSPQKSIDQKTKQIMEHFKLPQSIVVTKIPNTKQDNNSTEIIETPIKSTYCKQNFSESILEPEQFEDIPDKSLLDIKQQTMSLIQPQNQIINNLKTEAINSKIRQRKASIDIVPTASVNQQSTTNKTPRHNNLDYKSYAVNRSARKKEVLQRMRHIKKQIFKSIENGECVTKKIQRLKSPLVKPQRKRKILIENVQILPNLEKDALTPLINPFDNFKKPLESNANTPNLNTISPKNLADDQKQAKINLNSYKMNSSINDDEKLIKKSLKRPASSPLLNDDKPAKRKQKSPTKDMNQLADKAAELEATQLDLSESVVDFLQRDLKANRLNVDSFLNEELPIDDIAPDETSIESNAKESKTDTLTKDSESTNNSNLINDLLDQVDNEDHTQENLPNENNLNDETLKDDDTNIDFDEEKDISLLDKIGLKIIKCPDMEDTICLEERDKNMEKAKKFANIFKNWPRIWCTKNTENATLKQELEISFNQLLNETNLTFNLRLTLTEMKRLVNLINFWYGHNINNRLIEKRKILESTNRYLIIFNFIPKTAKRFCYCEYCEDYFNTEHKYFTHRIVHTGALYPYTCRKCSTGFRNIKQCKTHEEICKNIKICNNIKRPQITYENPKNRLHKCEICLETFTTSDLLYEHSKKHLKTVYNCVKCELVFASALDVQIHMSTCNTVTKRMPKQCTPRPIKTKLEKHVNV